MRLIATLLFAAIACCTLPVMADNQQGEAQYYQRLAALNRTAFALDYMLDPVHFIDVCYQVHSEKLAPLAQDDKARLVKTISPSTSALRKDVQGQEKKAALELVNDLYLTLKQNQYIDYKRFFEVYRDKSIKSKELIKQDLLSKEEMFISFLKLSKLPGEEYCQNKLHNDTLEEFEAHWPKDAQALREELDSIVAGATIPALYKESYRRLLE